MKYLERVSTLIINLIHAPGYTLNYLGKPDYRAVHIQLDLYCPLIKQELEDTIQLQPRRANKTRKVYMLEVVSLCKLLRHYMNFEGYATMEPMLKEVLYKMEDVQNELATMELV